MTRTRPSGKFASNRSDADSCRRLDHPVRQPTTQREALVGKSRSSSTQLPSAESASRAKTPSPLIEQAEQLIEQTKEFFRG
jgi:hypothetical protein